MSSGFDLDAYHARLGITEAAGLAELHRAHLSAIPFENLDPYRGVPVELSLDALADKLIHRRRGGYCFEQNLLLAAALQARGHRVDRHLARVRWKMPPGAPLSRTHLVLAVQDAGSTWLADVGFGPGSFLEPLPFAPGGPWEQSGWQLRIVEDDGQLVLQTVLGGDWRDVYEIDPVPVPLVDIEISNWWVCTHPTSRFVTGLAIGIVQPDGTYLTLRSGEELELVVRGPATSQRTAVTTEQVPELLATHFGLAGFSVGTDGRLHPGPT